MDDLFGSLLCNGFVHTVKRTGINGERQEKELRNCVTMLKCKLFYRIEYADGNFMYNLLIC